MTNIKEELKVNVPEVHTELAEVKEDNLKNTPGKHIKLTQVKLEDETEEKITVNIAQPTTGNKKTCLEIVEDEIGLTRHSSVL